MNKNDLSLAVANKTGLSRKEADSAVDSVLETILETLKAHEKVQLSGFGSFEVKLRAARTGYNPRTGSPMEIKETHKPVFRPAKGMRDIVG